MLFEKPSLRTRISFERAMDHLGGRASYFSPAEVGLGTREAVVDVARVLSRMADGIVARVFSHEALVAFASESRVPVVNGLSDEEHPCQALGDLLTILERAGAGEKPKVVFVGDGNNVAASLARGCRALGIPFLWIGPRGYEPRVRCATAHDPAAVSGARFVYTDVWTSMGQEKEAARRRRVFLRYQVNAELLARAPKAEVLHCLPARRGEEVTDEVLDGPRSLVYEQAENRIYAQAAVLEMLLG